MEKQILHIFTRTPLHVGSGASIGAIDQPIQRERHTGFPVIPGSSLKGSFADAWNLELYEQDGIKYRRLTSKKENDRDVPDQVSEAAWLFGSNHEKVPFSGAIQFSEAKLLAFPLRSARGGIAWITCPLILARAVRDGVFACDLLPAEVENLKDGEAIFQSGGPLKLEIPGENNQPPSPAVVLEEYTFTYKRDLPPELGTSFGAILQKDRVWQAIGDRLVILSDGMMSNFTKTACEVSQHVRIDDETGTAAHGALFNQENTPSETLFYSVVNFVPERTAGTKQDERRNAPAAIASFRTRLHTMGGVCQFGGDASTGLGYCTVELVEAAGQSKEAAV